MLLPSHTSQELDVAVIFSAPVLSILPNHSESGGGGGMGRGEGGEVGEGGGERGATEHEERLV